MIRLSAIGDCCHTLAVVRSIQSAWPSTKITWVIGRTELSLMEGVEGVEFITFDKTRGWRAYLEVRSQLRGRRFPVLLHMHASMRANIASRMIRAKLRLGYDRARARDSQWLFTNAHIPATPEQHVLDGMFSFIEYLGLSERGHLRWDIPIGATDRQFGNDVCAAAGPTCVISPCSSQRFRNFRNWSVDNYVALIDYLHDTYGANIVLTGGPTDIEMEYGERIAARAAGPVTNLIGGTSLKQLLAIIDGASVVVCPDSGPAHMATTVGTPVVGLYATSNRRRTGPYFSQHLVADRYPEAVRREFGKEVSEVAWGQRVRDPDAMNLITLGDVTAKADLVLGPGRTGHQPILGPV
ncbi:MAG: glycosyltransferase family 9 protein [Gammaproteobacteria bacterium]